MTCSLRPITPITEGCYSRVRRSSIDGRRNDGRRRGTGERDTACSPLHTCGAPTNESISKEASSSSLSLSLRSIRHPPLYHGARRPSPLRTARLELFVRRTWDRDAGLSGTRWSPGKDSRTPRRPTVVSGTVCLQASWAVCLQSVEGMFMKIQVTEGIQRKKAPSHIQVT
jgi:hypothetical protein